MLFPLCHFLFSFPFINFISSYPDKRVKKDAKDLDMGVIGSVSLLQNANLSTQPITSFDWSPDKVSQSIFVLEIFFYLLYCLGFLII